MKKFWIVYCTKNNGTFKQFDNYEAAEECAKRFAASAASSREDEFIIMEAIATTKQPVPDIQVVKL